MALDYNSAYNNTNNRRDYLDDLNAQAHAQTPPITVDVHYALTEYARLDGNSRNQNSNTKTGLGATLIGGIDSIFGSQKEEHSGKYYPGEFKNIQETFRLLLNDSQTGFETIGGITRNIFDEIGKSFLGYYQQQSDLLTNLNENAGISGELSKDFREEITKTSVYANRLGISFDEVSRSMSSILENSGRFRVMNEETMNSIALTSKIAFKNIEDASASIESFQNISLGASDAMEVISDAALKSFQLGLNAKKTTETMMTSLDKLNQFGFKNGVEGLNRMVQRSLELKTNLNSVFDLADSVMDPSKAIELSANLQVIGGALGDFNDPIKMMYMATNNIEGLQEALIGSVEQLAEFNRESGRFEITGVNLRRAKAMAEALGMSYSDLATTAVNAAQRTSALGDMLASGLIIDEDLQEFVTNMAQMKSGRMVVEITSAELQEKLGGKTEIALNEMTESQAMLLKGYQEEFKEMKTTDIAIQQVNLIKNIERNLSFVAATMRHELLGTDVNKIMDAAGLNINGANAEIKSIADQTTTFIKELNGSLFGVSSNQTITPNQKATRVIDAQYDNNSLTTSNNSTNFNRNSTSSTPDAPQNAVTNKLYIDLNIKGDQVFDEFKRWLLKNVDIWGSQFNEYVKNTAIR